MTVALSFHIFDSLLEPCFILNSEAQVIYANETAATLAGTSLRRVLNKGLEDIFTIQESLPWLAQLNSVTDATPYKEVNFTNKNGEHGRAQLTCQKVTIENEESGWLVFVRDVTLEDRLQQKYRAELTQKEGFIVDLQKAHEQLESYNKNLEGLVAERTSEISKLNQTMTGLLDSLDDGFFIIHSDGNCLDFSSKSCLTVLETTPNNQPAWKVLGLPESKADGFKKWLTTVFAEMLPFEDLAPLAPSEFSHSVGKKIQLKYYPLRGKQDAIEGIICVAHDYSEVYHANIMAEKEKNRAAMIVQLVQRKNEISRFWTETSGQFSELSGILKKPFQHWDLDLSFRILHTIKGNSASYHLADLAHHTHDAETFLTKLKDNYDESTFNELKQKCNQMRLDFVAFEDFAGNIFGGNLKKQERTIEVPESALNKIIGSLQESSNTLAIQKIGQELYQKYFLEELGPYFTSFDKVLQTVATKTGKECPTLIIENGSIRANTHHIQPLFNTLVHAFVNAIDHGIENSETRIARGKPAQGTIRVVLENPKPNLLQIQIIDDGNGIDPQKIRSKLDTKNRAHVHETDEEVIQHIFDPSFSTKEHVSDTSGRGVGMDAIAHASRQLGGTCKVTSSLGSGSTLWIQIPLSPSMPIPKAA